MCMNERAAFGGGGGLGISPEYDYTYKRNIKKNNKKKTIYTNKK